MSPRPSSLTELMDTANDACAMTLASPKNPDAAAGLIRGVVLVPLDNVGGICSTLRTAR